MLPFEVHSVGCGGLMRLGRGVLFCGVWYVHNLGYWVYFGGWFGLYECSLMRWIPGIMIRFFFVRSKIYLVGGFYRIVE